VLTAGRSLCPASSDLTLWLQVLMQLVSTLFDLSSNLNTSIPVNVWQRAARALFQIMDLLQEHQHIVIDETLEVTAERIEEPPVDAPFRVSGNLRAFVERLDDELFKILQVCAPWPACLPLHIHAVRCVQAL
jgi:hypothetical protein